MNRPGASATAERFHAQWAARLRALDADGLDAELHRLVQAHAQHLDHDCINLYAGTNMPNPRVSALLSSPIGSRPNLGWPGDKYNTGMAHAEPVEVMLVELLRQVFGARYAEYRVPSGSLANLYAYMATCRPGDAIVAFSDAAGGHPTHHAVGAAGLYGLQVHEMPFDSARMDVDLDALRTLAWAVQPKLMIVAGSLCLFPYDVAGVRAIADEVGARVLYDAAHMGGLIAGGLFQRPLAQGAHLMTGSTYKSLGGPPAGFVLTDDAELAQRLDAVAYPGLTANFDLSRSAALALALLDVQVHGRDYARAMCENALALAQALAAQGVPVFQPGGRDAPTASHHVALDARTLGGGNRASRVAQDAHLLFTSIGLPLPAVPGDANGIRLGTQEVTRWGMGAAQMDEIARLVARVLVRGETADRVRADVQALRRGFQQLHFVRTPA